MNKEQEQEVRELIDDVIANKREFLIITYDGEQSAFCSEMSNESLALSLLAHMQDDDDFLEVVMQALATLSADMNTPSIN